MMALDNNHLLFSQQLPLLLDNTWDPHYSLGLGHGGDNELNNIMPTLDIDSPMSSETSTGYLQDAVAQWSNGCKRRRLGSGSGSGSSSSSPCDHEMFMGEDIQQLFQGFWDSTCSGDPLGSLNCNMVEDTSTLSGDNLQNCSSQVVQQELISSPCSYQKEPTHQNTDIKDNKNSMGYLGTLKGLHALKEKENEQQEQDRRRRMKKVVYPFTVLKPAGLEGDVTLADINERILMRPTRPVKHPVGEFAFGPCVSAIDGQGLSGKVVVGLTRIHTQGRGTITIIRTRG